MSSAIPLRPQTRALLRPILVGGAVAGTLDHLSAMITFGPLVSRAIAAGLVGRWALQAGTGILILGLVLHFVIAFTAAAVYCFASRRLPFLREHWLVCGMFYGIGVFLVMNLIVLPLCALHAAGPYQLHGLIRGILVHMFIIGLPISFSLRKLS